MLKPQVMSFPTPEPEAVIEPGDVIVGVGTSEELQRLEDLFAVGS